MNGMRSLRSLMLAIVVLAGIAAVLLSRQVGYRHQTGGEDSLGATLVPASAAGPLLVDSLRSGGEAEHAGLRVGDRIEAVGSRAARSKRDVEHALATHHSVLLHVRRAGHTLPLTVTSHRS
ncbi:PDZ domain-containing protein [Sphingomonas sp. UNC305MFCol5.2]|uniref:PDZ domain-containing protein n=1 Tax=Sphingomonas sp. UNC305MFCol5.2 TaxID=1449076 RepID=UPI000472BAC8|nr:PDZ domain-containing protein [Sphingomonas sp. UNC305MFCol5.2]